MTRKRVKVVSSSDEEAPETTNRRSQRGRTAPTTAPVVSPRVSTRQRSSTSGTTVAPKTKASEITNTPHATRTSSRRKAEESSEDTRGTTTIATRSRPASVTKTTSSSTRITRGKKPVAKKAPMVLDGLQSGDDDSNDDSDDDHDMKDTSDQEDENDSTTTSPWIYPDLLDPGNMPSIKSEDMEVDRTKGYILDHILRAHSLSTHDGQDDDDTDAWAAAFQPTLPVIRSGPTDHDGNDSGSSSDSNDAESSDDEDKVRRKRLKRNRQNANAGRRGKRSSSIVATCGGNTVCLIDCRLGKVMAKYSHVEEEQFMSLAWTTLDHTYEEASNNEGKKSLVPEEVKHERQINILAAAGRMGSIKLINPLQNTCYKYLHGHTEAVIRLKFSLTNPRWLFSASIDGTARLWDIGSASNYEHEACCLAKFIGLDESSVTAIGVSEKYLIVGTTKGLMAQYNLFELNKRLEQSRTDSRKQILNVEPERLYPPSQEWHESAVDEIVYIPYFSEKSDSDDQSANDGGASTDDAGTKDAEFVFASRENCQGEILVWNATKSTKADADLKTILEWTITESWAKFTLAENMIAIPRKTDADVFLKKKSWEERRQNVLVAGSTDGKVVLFDLNLQPKRKKDRNIIAAKSTNNMAHPISTELLRDVAVSEDLSMVVAADWSNRVFIWTYHEDIAL
ncbi:MAG: WD40-repeat-containing domain protein [Benniella sp.]|nr:MAG: WD40-repeat-containing domain protein [Benniella sp.]